MERPVSVVYKYPVPRPDSEGKVVIAMPTGAHVLSFAFQRSEPFVWALADPKKPSTGRAFVLLMTGQSTPVQIDLYRFIGTAMTDDGGFVLHLWQRPAD